MIRELREELGVTVERPDIRLHVVLHSQKEHEADREYLHFFFAVRNRGQVPVIAEPDKCTELVWADPARLPADTVDYVIRALEALRAGEVFVAFGWSPEPRTR